MNATEYDDMNATESSTRPEHVKCVQQTHAERKHLTWCGLSAAMRWMFVDIDHAALNGEAEGISNDLR